MKEKLLSSSSGRRKLSCRLLRRKRSFFTQSVIMSSNFCPQTLRIVKLYMSMSSKIKTDDRVNSRKQSPLKVIKYKTLVSGSGSPWLQIGGWGFQAITGEKMVAGRTIIWHLKSFVWWKKSPFETVVPVRNIEWKSNFQNLNFNDDEMGLQLNFSFCPFSSFSKLAVNTMLFHEVL